MQKSDHGSTGPAMQRRPALIADADDAGMSRRVCLDTTLLDRLAQQGKLGDDAETARRVAAGEWLANVYRKAYPPKSVTFAYGQVRGLPGEDETYENRRDPSGPDMDAQVWHRLLLNDLNIEIGGNCMTRLRNAIVYHTCGDVMVLRADLDALAKQRGIG